MAGIIIVTGQETATNADMLQGTRLQTVPAGGTLTFEFQNDLNVAASNYSVSIQLPGGETPMNGVAAPAATASLAGVIDERTDLQATFAVTQGGHCVFSGVETGTVIFTWRVTYTPF